MTTWQPRDTRVDNGNAKPEGWISPEEQGRRDYAAFRDARRGRQMTTDSA